MGIVEYRDRTPLSDTKGVDKVTYELVKDLYCALIRIDRFEALDKNSPSYREIKLSSAAPYCPPCVCIDFWRTKNEEYEQRPEFAMCISSGFYDSEGRRHAEARFFDVWIGESFSQMIQRGRKPYFTVHKLSSELTRAFKLVESIENIINIRRASAISIRKNIALEAHRI